MIAALTIKKPAYILVFENGYAIPLSHDEYTDALRFSSMPSHIVINLNKILRKIYSDQDMRPIFDSQFTLSDEGREMFFMLRTGDFEEIKVKMKDGKIERLETSKDENVRNKIVELPQKGDSRDIELK